MRFLHNWISGKFFYPMSLYSSNFLILKNLPWSIVLTSLTRKEWFWLVECSKIAGCLLRILSYNSCFPCMTFFFLCCSCSPFYNPSTCKNLALICSSSKLYSTSHRLMNSLRSVLSSPICIPARYPDPQTQ